MNFKTFALTMAAIVGSVVHATPARADQPYLGEIMTMGTNFCPRGYASTDGQLLAIKDYTALFSLLGTLYGGDGRTTFALPDLRGRVPVHAGQAPGYPRIAVGQKSGDTPVGAAGAEPNAPRSQPVLGVKYCIAVVGIFPPRD